MKHKSILTARASEREREREPGRFWFQDKGKNAGEEVVREEERVELEEPSGV